MRMTMGLEPWAAQAMLKDVLLRGSKADLITRAAPAPQRTCNGFGHAYLQLHAANGVVDGVISLQPNCKLGCPDRCFSEHDPRLGCVPARQMEHCLGHLKSAGMQVVAAIVYGKIASICVLDAHPLT